MNMTPFQLRCQVWSLIGVRGPMKPTKEEHTGEKKDLSGSEDDQQLMGWWLKVHCWVRMTHSINPSE
jgi:hypothetical protein